MNEEPWWVWPALGLAAVAGGVQVWRSTARPWLEEKWADATAGDALLTVPGLGELDDTDLIGIGLLVLIVLAVVTATARRWRARRAEREDGAEEQQRKTKTKAKRGIW